VTTTESLRPKNHDLETQEWPSSLD